MLLTMATTLSCNGDGLPLQRPPQLLQEDVLLFSQAATEGTLTNACISLGEFCLRQKKGCTTHGSFCTAASHDSPNLPSDVGSWEQTICQKLQRASAQYPAVKQIYAAKCAATAIPEQQAHGAFSGQSAAQGLSSKAPLPQIDSELRPASPAAPQEPPMAPAPAWPPATNGQYDMPGGFEVGSGKAGPNNAFTLYYPKNLGAGGLKHPIITWGNGTAAPTAVYNALLAHWASHGFIVIASDSTMAGSGKEMLEGVNWLLTENARPDSGLFQRLNPLAIGASGHSQGGGGSIAAGNDINIKCILPIEPAPGNVGGLKGPMFVIGGSNDFIVAPGLLVGPMVYNPSPVPTVYGILNGADHFTPTAAGSNSAVARSLLGYTTAWFRAHLMNDAVAATMFFGESCHICRDPLWQVQRKNM
jgi:hypothetical protein